MSLNLNNSLIRRITDRSRLAKITLIFFVLLAIIPAGGGLFDTSSTIYFLTHCSILALAAVSLDLIIGYGALVSFGHAMFFALGGYVVGICGFHFSEQSLILGWSGSLQAMLVWPLSILLCGLLGLVTGFLSLRTRGMQFIMITLAFGQLLFIILTSLKVYGGDEGLLLSQRSIIPGIDMESPLSFYYLCLALLAAWTVFCLYLVNSRFGMVLQSIMQSKRRAVSLGASPLPYRLSAFVLSAMGTGLAGILWANFQSFVSPEMSSWMMSGELIAIVILGGIGTLLGPILGTMVFVGLEQFLSAWTEHWMIIMGPTLVVIALFARNGLFGGLLRGKNDK